MKLLYKTVLSMALLLSMSLSSVAKTVEAVDTLTAIDVYADIPLQVLDMIRPSSRLDMIDYYQQLDSLLSVADALGGSSRLEKVARDYLKLSVTPVSTLEIKLLPYKKDREIIMTLYTVGGEGMAKDTEVAFFDSEMHPLSSDKFLKRPNILDFFNLKGSGISEKEVLDMVPFAALEYTTDEGEAPLKVTLSTQQVLSDEIRNVLTHVLNPELTAVWKGKYSFN